MRQLLCCLLLLCVLFVGCETAADSAESSTQIPSEAPQTLPDASDEPEIPQDLPGVWVSADAGKLMLSETITFGEDGSLTVSGTYQGSDAGTVYGTYRVEYNRILCSITGGTTPFDVSYQFRIDGRELILTDDDGEAHYLRTS